MPGRPYRRDGQSSDNRQEAVSRSFVMPPRGARFSCSPNRFEHIELLAPSWPPARGPEVAQWDETVASEFSPFLYMYYISGLTSSLTVSGCYGDGEQDGSLLNLFNAAE